MFLIETDTYRVLPGKDHQDLRFWSRTLSDVITRMDYDSEYEESFTSAYIDRLVAEETGNYSQKDIQMLKDSLNV